ncbi:MAG: choice-of-anchor D domain-containing protein, partial [Chloroflexota bacterium]
MKRNVLLPMVLLILVSIVSNVSGVYQASPTDIYLPLSIKDGTQSNEPDIAYSLPTVKFEQIEQNQQDSQNLTIFNNGLQTLSISSLTTTINSFTVTNPTSLPANIAPGNSLNVTIQFMPTSIGTINGELVIVSNDPDEASVSIPLTGEGTTPPADVGLSVPELDFGQVVVGSFADLTFDIENDGDQTLSVSGISTTDAQFTV